MIRKLLLLGDERLYDVSEPVMKEALSEVKEIVQDLHDTMMAYRQKYGVGRAIAAPQIGAFKRVVYMNIGTPITFINPVIHFPDDEMMELLDDCMCFPGLLVKVNRHVRCEVHFKDLEWQDQTLFFEGDLSELFQHEYDHLDGILATMRAKDEKAFIIKAFGD